MFCKQCGKEITENAEVCTHCGARQTPPVQIKSHLAEAIITTLCCCLPFGIVSIVYAAKVSSLCRAAMLQARSRRRQKLPCGHGLHSAPELSSMESILRCRCSGLLRIMQHPDFRESAGNDPVKKIKQERLVKLLFFIFLAAAGGIGLIFLYFHNPVATRWLPRAPFTG